MRTFLDGEENIPEGRWEGDRDDKTREGGGKRDPGYYHSHSPINIDDVPLISPLNDPV